MCGICGMIARKGGADREPVRRMQSALMHRGPDAGGTFSDDGVELAMRRLSIIDLEGGTQPLFNEDRSLVLMANGEVYNYIELRKSLRSRGHEFRTQSDCETILHLYEEKGIDCLHGLRGMFAFALWDTRGRKLLLARDRMGEKPLYLHESGNGLLFSSELRSILASGLIGLEPDPRGIDLYFHYRYIPEPWTPIKGVRKLPAGHYLSLDIETWNIAEKCYWRMDDAPEIRGNPAQVIREQLDEVAELVIRSDVPVGVALSGGLDSSAIAALAQKKYRGNMHAFCIGYEGRPACDERLSAKAFADHLGMEFHEAELGISEFVTLFPRLAAYSDDPIADISAYGYYSLSRLARSSGVPVLLQGQGGDELFWGYPWVRRAAAEAVLKRRLHGGLDKAVLAYCLPTLPERFDWSHLRSWVHHAGGVPNGWKTLRRHQSEPPERVPFYNLIGDFQETEALRRSLYGPLISEALHDHTAYAPFTVPLPWPDPAIMHTRLISETYLLENGIAQGDRLSMASSVELRLPLVDFRLVETVVGLRKGCPDLALPPKAWLREAVAEDVPKWVMERPKRGFEPPVRAWCKALEETYSEDLGHGLLGTTGILRAEALQDQHLSCNGFHTVMPLFFVALVLEFWYRGMRECLRSSSQAPVASYL